MVTGGRVKVLDFGTGKVRARRRRRRSSSAMADDGAPDRHRRRDRHARLHVAGAGPRPARRSPHRHLLLRRAALRDGHGQPPLPRRGGQRDLRGRAARYASGTVQPQPQAARDPGQPHRGLPQKGRGAPHPDRPRAAPEPACPGRRALHPRPLVPHGDGSPGTAAPPLGRPGGGSRRDLLPGRHSGRHPAAAGALPDRPGPDRPEPGRGRRARRGRRPPAARPRRAAPRQLLEGPRILRGRHDRRPDRLAVRHPWRARDLAPVGDALQGLVRAPARDRPRARSGQHRPGLGDARGQPGADHGPAHPRRARAAALGAQLRARPERRPVAPERGGAGDQPGDPGDARARGPAAPGGGQAGRSAGLRRLPQGPTRLQSADGRRLRQRPGELPGGAPARSEARSGPRRHGGRQFPLGVLRKRHRRRPVPGPWARPGCPSSTPSWPTPTSPSASSNCSPTATGTRPRRASGERSPPAPATPRPIISTRRSWSSAAVRKRRSSSSGSSTSSIPSPPPPA